MSGPAITAVPTQNRILAALTGDARARIFPHLELVSLPLGKILREAGNAQGHVYFPIDCIVSRLYALEGGESVEVAVAGNEGLIGVASFMGGESTPNQAVVVSAGVALRVQTQRLKDEFDRHDETMRLLLRYAQSLMTQVAQTAACNRRHTIDQQLCRWFLLAMDRVGSSRLAITHELLAHLLGVRRESISEAACKLQKAAVIAYCHGRVTVLDRRRLEQLSCECYAVVRRETDRLLPGSDGATRDARPPLDAIAHSPAGLRVRPHALDPRAAGLPNRYTVGHPVEVCGSAKVA